MNFNSLEFLVYLAVVLFLYFVLPHKFRWVLLLIASYFFYMSWNATLIFLIVGTTVVSYVAAILIERTQNKAVKKFWLILTLVVCLGVLFFFKYFNFMLESVIAILNFFTLDVQSITLQILLPVGISFYTFQTLSYVIDVYKGEYKAEKHFGYYALFVSYFPQLVAGPIERADNLLPQLKVHHKLNADDMYAGFKIMLSGFFRKCVIADFCGIFVNNVFNNSANANALSVLAAGALFGVQMYNDFAGYSEIAMGVARMMGVKLMKNFNKPYTSQSFTEFFRRWHISLTKWFTDYVYIPLGGSRKGLGRKILNTVIVFALCGLWHGASWTYVLWGLYSALILTIESLWRPTAKEFCENHKINLKNPAIIAVRRGIVYLLVIFGALIFRSQSIEQLGQMYDTLFTGFGENFISVAVGNLNVTAFNVLQIAVCIMAMCCLPKLCEERTKEDILPLKTTAGKAVYMQQIATCVFAVLAIACYWLALLATSDVSSFAYFQF